MREAAVRLAEAQAGLISARQLRGLEVSRRSVTSEVRSGRLVVVRPRLYRLANPPDLIDQAGAALIALAPAC